MSLNLIKLAVGVTDIAHLAQLQYARVKQSKKDKRWDNNKSCPRHITRHRPRREDELLDGGSLYWVIKGTIRARQTIITMDEVPLVGLEARDGKIPKPKCALVLDPEIVPVMPARHRAFQGWRYFEGAKVPIDVTSSKLDLPDDLAAELGELGLL